MTNIIHLSPTDIINERPFTHPAHILAEMKILRTMIDRLCLVIENHPIQTPLSYPVIVSEPDGRSHRLALIHPERLRQPGALVAVGFFGQRRSGVFSAPVDEMDAILVAELVEYPGLLSYGTLALRDGNFGNLILFENLRAKNHWSGGKIHARAVTLAPDYYYSVRIYNGILPDGITASSTLRLTEVKYFDYQSQPLWRATRKLEGDRQ